MSMHAAVPQPAGAQSATETDESDSTLAQVGALPISRDVSDQLWDQMSVDDELVAEVSREGEAYLSAAPSAETIRTDLLATADWLQSAHAEGQFGAFQESFGSDDFGLIIDSVYELANDQLFLEQLSDAMQDPAFRTSVAALGLWDTVKNIGRGAVYGVVGLAVGAACVGTGGIGCPVAIALGATIIGTTEAAILVGDNINNNARSYSTDAITCSGSRCAFAGRATSTRWTITGVSSSWNFSTPAYSSMYCSGTGSATYVASNPNVWNVQGNSCSTSSIRCYPTVALTVLVYWADGNYTRAQNSTANSGYSGC